MPQINIDVNGQERSNFCIIFTQKGQRIIIHKYISEDLFCSIALREIRETRIASKPTTIIQNISSISPSWNKYGEDTSNFKNGRLDHAPWSAFKMSDVWRRGGDESLEHAKWHYFTIRDHVKGAICITVPILPLKQASEKAGLLGTIAANPYFWGFKGLVHNLARQAPFWGLKD
ncbi:MAG: hypothetical protein V3R20_00360 [Sphingomonadales bacterium]